MYKMRNLKERICAFLLALVLALTGILPNIGMVAQAADTNAHFFIYEEDATNPEHHKIPIKGAVLKINGQMYTTDENGKCDAAAVAEGAKIVVERSGYKPLTSNPTVQTATTDENRQEIELTMADISLKSDAVVLQSGMQGSIAFTDGTKIEDANELAYTWSVVSGEDKADIDPATGMITAKARGTATIKVARNGSETEKEITIKDRFTMNIVATPTSRGEGDTTEVMVTVEGIPTDAGSVAVSATGTSKLGPQTVTGASNTTIFMIPPGRQDITFQADYAETADYFGASASTGICTYKQNQSISVAADFVGNYTYGDEAIDLAAKVQNAGRRNIRFELDEASAKVLAVNADNKLDILASGTARVKVIADENDNYTKASVLCTITVAKKTVEKIKVRDIAWQPAEKVYDGTDQITLTGTLTDSNGLLPGDSAEVTAVAKIAKSDVGEYTIFDYVNAEIPENDKYEITLDETDKTDIAFTGTDKITVSQRNLYVQIKEGTSVSIPYGSTNDEIETIIKDKAVVELVGGTGKLDSDAESGLAGTDKVDISSAVKPVLKDKADKMYYVGTYADAVCPSIITENQGNYRLVIGEPISDYSGELVITNQVVEDKNIIPMLKFADGYGIYKDGSKIWTKNNTRLGVTVQDGGYTDVNLKRGEADSYQTNEIVLSTDQKENVEVNDIAVYLFNKDDISNATRTTKEAGKIVDNVIPAGTIVIDNKLPEVHFSTELGMFGEVNALTGNLIYNKFTGKKYAETIQIADDGSGLTKDENGKETYGYKFYEVTDPTTSANDAIKAAAADTEGWNQDVSGQINVPTSKEGYYVILVKVKDNVGNEAVYASNGIVVDTTAPTVSITGIDNTKVYGEDVVYKVTAEDALSRIDKIAIEVQDKDGNIIPGSAAGENSFIEEGLVVGGLTKEELEAVENTYEIDAKVLASINGNGVKVKATAYDKAGNPTVSDEQTLNLDTIPPTAVYSYDNNTYESVDGNAYFASNRIMTIAYTERNFDPSKAVFKINVDGTDYTTNLESWNTDLENMGVRLLPNPEDTQQNAQVYTEGRTLTYQIEFGEDQAEHEYKITEMSVVDKADKKGSITPAEGTQAASEFTIDRKPSEINISYDLTDTDAENDTFFKNVRVMTVIYKEKYFAEENVELTLKQGDTRTLAEWLAAQEKGIKFAKESETGDSHVYTVAFGGEGLDIDYSVSTAIKDFAGNPNSTVNYEEDITKTKESFTVDMADPEVAIELNSDQAVNDSYYQKDCIATVTYRERNFDESGLTFDVVLGSEDSKVYTLDELVGGKADGISVVKGISENADEYTYQITFNGGKTEDQDYAITPHIRDKAGNAEKTTPEGSKFTVDKVKPTVDVEYYIVDGGSTKKTDVTTEEMGRLYTNKQVQAVVTITERNFSLSDQFSAANKQMTAAFLQDGSIMQEEKISAEYSENWELSGKDEWKQTFTFDVPEKTGDSDFEFQIAYKDLADNIAVSKSDQQEQLEKTYYLTVDKIAPEISVTYYYIDDNNRSIEVPEDCVKLMDNGERYYQQNKLEVRYEITERNFVREPNKGSFDKDQMHTQYKHVDAAGTSIEDTLLEYDKDAADASNWNYNSNDKVADQTFKFCTEANYTIGMTYQDLAGNQCIYADHQFTVDWTAPTGKITIPDSNASTGGSWSSGEDAEHDGIWSVLKKIFYQFFTNKDHGVTLESNDVIAGVAGTYYYIDKTATGKKTADCLTEDELNEKDWTPYSEAVTVVPDSQAAFYEKVVDHSGNITYLNAEYGIIADQTEPILQLNDISSMRNGIHKDSATIKVDIEDPMVNGVYAGIDRVGYVIRSTTNQIATKQGTVAMTYKESDDERVRIGTGYIEVSKDEFNSNDITVTVTAYDKAGNSFDREIELKIDKTAPEISISWNTDAARNGKYYNVTRVATITVKERNFDRQGVNLRITNTDGVMPQISDWTVDTSGTSDNNINTCTVTFAADGDYTLYMDCIDLAGNQSSNAINVDEFTIDKTAPTINVTFDNNNVANGKYYNAARTATITVNEHNFNGAEVQTAITSNTVTPGVHGWSGGGDVHTASVPFVTDGNYSFTVNYTDLAGNPAQVYNVNEFVIDLTKPEIEIFDIEDKSANNGEVAPGVRYSDTNYDVNGVSITYSGAKHDEKAVDGARTDIPNGESIKMADFEHVEDVDDVYTMTAKVTDLAGNFDEKQVTFSVNRFGSNFIFSDETEEFLEDYYNNEEENLVVTEINVDTLTHRGIACGHDGNLTDLEEGTDYSVKESGTEVSWKSYEYTIKKDNFEKEGLYNITIDSVDRATNEVNNKIKEADIEFVIDKTAPTVVITGVENEGQYRANERDITIATTDNVAMERVEVYVDDDKNPAESYNVKTIQRQKGELPYTLTSSSNWQEVKAIAVDMAGNVTDTSRPEGSDEEEWLSVLVTANVFVQFYRNTTLVIGTLIGIVVLGGIIFLILAKRRKDDEEKKAAK